MFEPGSWRRHDLLRVEPHAWLRLWDARPQCLEIPHVSGWAALGWPLIVRRRAPDDDPGTIPVALSLPPACGKLRLAIRVAPEDVRERMPPQTLRTLREEAPPSWQKTISALLEVAEQTGVEPRVFGSVLWQRLTGLSYLSTASDLDLLWPVVDADSAARIVPRLAVIEQTGPVRVDGEILLADGSGVQWREWRDSPSAVLVKTASCVELRAVRDLPWLAR